MKAYQIEQKEGQTVVKFQTPRAAYFLPILFVSGVVFLVVRYAFLHHWNEQLIAGLVGGSVSVIAVTCFALAPYLVHRVIEITTALIVLRRTFLGLPVGGRRTYARSNVTDLGFYPSERRPGPQMGTLCIWVNRSSVELEHHFLASQGAALAEELTRLGIRFSRTYPFYDSTNLLFDKSQDYLTF